MDPPRKDEWEALKEALLKIKASHGKAVLFSDTGMPLLFDPGREVLAFCREHNFKIRSIAGPTSWGAACSLSGFLEPFHIEGFPPRDQTERIKKLKELSSLSAMAR